MTVKENNNCIKLMNEAIKAGEQAKQEFQKAYDYRLKCKEEDFIILQQAQKSFRLCTRNKSSVGEYWF